MDFRLSAEQELLQRSVPEFAETEIRPHVRKWDEEQHFPSELVPALALGLLGEEGQGFAGAMQVLDGGRIGIAALSVGLAQGAYEAALHYSQERRAFGSSAYFRLFNGSWPTTRRESRPLGC